MGGKSITQQIDEGIRFHTSRRHSATGYLAYFQSYSNTYAPLDILRMRYEEALVHPLVSGLVIGTRPDCVDEEKLDYLASLSKQHYVMVEYGIESCYDRTLASIGRGHDYACTCHAIQATARRGIACGGHLILGLPAAGDTPTAPTSKAASCLASSAPNSRAEAPLKDSSTSTSEEGLQWRPSIT